MSDETPKKPSETVLARSAALKPVFMAHYRSTAEKAITDPITDEVWAEFLASDQGALVDSLFGVTAIATATVEYLDTEAERRSAWEAQVDSSLRALAILVNGCSTSTVGPESRASQDIIDALIKRRSVKPSPNCLPRCASRSPRSSTK